MYRDSAALLKRLGHESIPPRAKVGALRPAAQQIVSIARALSGDVRLLIMDEPSAILDDAEIETLFEVVRRLTAEGVGVVYISHRLDEIRRIGDRVTVLADGRTMATGLPATTPTDELVELMVGRKVEQLYPDRPVGTDRLLLEVRGARRLPDGPRREPQGPRRRGRRARRARRLRAHRAAAPRLRARPAGRGRVPRRRQAAEGQQPRRRDPPRDGPGAGGSQVAGARPRLEPDEERHALRPRPLLASAAEHPHRAGARPRRAAQAQHRPRRSRPPPSACCRAATSRRSCSRAGSCTSAGSCCSTSRPAGSTSRRRPRSTRSSRDLASDGLGVLVVSSELEELVGICTRILVMREGEIVAEVDGKTATERELLRHAVAPTDAPVLAEEVT